MRPFPGREPIFVDPSGRRRRSVRRLGVLLAVPAAGYVVLLISSLLGGPAPNTPLIPLPGAAQQLSKPKPVVTPSVVPTETRTTSRPTPTPTPSSRPTTVVPTTPRPTTPSQSVTPTTAPSPTATPGTRQRGKPTAPPGKTKTPSKP